MVLETAIARPLNPNAHAYVCKPHERVYCFEGAQFTAPATYEMLCSRSLNTRLMRCCTMVTNVAVCIAL